MDNGPAQQTEFVPEVPREARFHNDDAHLHPTRWWFASAAFPMVAGTLGPVASAFSICALVRQWRQHVSPATPVDNAVFVHDPPWLTIINAVQLAVALVSNAFLLLNMTRRVRFSVAQPVTIVGWYISAVCLVALIAAAAGSSLKGLERPAGEYVWSQAFFYGVWAAILYFVDASLMAVTFWGASAGRYSKDFNLTRSQRTLMLQSIMLLVYLLVGALVFSSIEDWHYLDAVYWADVTLFTIGFGDFVPTTTLARALLFPYALVGVISLGLVISSIRSLILERGRRRVDARMEEKNRRRTIRNMTRKGNDDMLTPLERDDEQDEVPPGELGRRQSEFDLMRGIQHSASARRRWAAMAVSTASWLILALGGAAVFQRCERAYQDWTYFESVYFCFVSLMTIGYGDFVPVSNAGKSFFVFWSLLALPTMTVLISNAEDTVIKFVRDATISVGNVTILPGDESFGGEAKHMARRLTCGQVFRRRRGDDAREPRGRDAGAPADAEASPDADAADDGSASPPPTPARCSLSRIRARLDALPSGHDLHLLLISEIQAVSRHVREAKPRRYSFEEWAWYLGLMGEDERDPQTHLKALPKEKHWCGRRRRRQPPEAPEQPDGHERHKWSWVGHRSPLVGGQEESEWVLERLMERLRESLWTTKRPA